MRRKRDENPPSFVGSECDPNSKNSKKPVVAWKRYQTELYQKEQIESWDGNFAVVCGTISKLVVVDFDQYSLWKRFFSDVNTFTVRAPNGGVHLYFRGISPKILKFHGYPVDVQGDGSYVLCPPSEIDGKRYEILKNEEIMNIGSVSEFLSGRLPLLKETGALSILEIKKRIDISNYVREYIKVEYEGKGYWQGLCPFHTEEVPSFTVYRDSYYCFGCGACGDVIKFVQEFDRL